MTQAFRIVFATIAITMFALITPALAKKAADKIPDPQSQPVLPSAPPTLTLRAAVDIATENNPLLRESREAAVQSEYGIPVARSALLPNISGVGTAIYEKDAANRATINNFGGDPYNTYNAALKATQPLFFYGSFSAVDVAKKSYEIAKVNTEITQRNLVSTVINDYYSLLLDMQNVDTFLRQQQIEQESLKTANDRERTGRGQLLDVLQVKTQLALLIAQIANAQNQVQIAAAQLANALGESQRTQLHVYGALDAPSIAVIDSTINLHNFRLPELDSNFLSIQQVDDERDVLLGQQLPKLTANGQYGYLSYLKSDLFDGSSREWQIGVELDIPIFSGLSYVFQRKALISQQTQLQIDRTNIENNLTLAQVTSPKKSRDRATVGCFRRRSSSPGDRIFKRST